MGCHALLQGIFLNPWRPDTPLFLCLQVCAVTGKFGAHLHRDDLDQSVSWTLPISSPTYRAHLGDGWVAGPSCNWERCVQRWPVGGEVGDGVAEAEAVGSGGRRRASQIRVLLVVEQRTPRRDVFVRVGGWGWTSHLCWCTRQRQGFLHGEDVLGVLGG